MIHLGSIGGTTIRVDLTFIILVVFFVASAYNPNHGLHYALLWAPVLLISVLIHELAHAAAIALFGYGSSEIVLGGMGGVTMNRRKSRPWHDMTISLAGPISSFVIWIAMLLAYARFPLLRKDAMLTVFIPMLAQANLWWGIFNLLPISPLDGGQAVRNFFRMFLNERTAFVIAVWIAMIAGVAVAVLGLKQGMIFLTLLIGWYVYMNYQAWQYFREHGVPGD